MQSGSHHASRQSRSDLRHPGNTRVPLVSSTHAPLVQCRSLLCMGRPGVLSMNLRIGYSSALSAAGGGCRCWYRSSVPSYLRMAFPPFWLPHFQAQCPRLQSRPQRRRQRQRLQQHIGSARPRLFCLVRMPVCPSFLFGIGGRCVLALAALPMVSTGHGPYQFLFPPVATLVFARSKCNVRMIPGRLYRFCWVVSR